MIKLWTVTGFCTFVDDEDYAELNQYEWVVKPGHTTYYVHRQENGKAVFIHRQITKATKGLLVHHIDGDGLNNEESNLIVCTHKEHGAYRKKFGCRDSVLADKDTEFFELRQLEQKIAKGESCNGQESCRYRY